MERVVGRVAHRLPQILCGVGVIGAGDRIIDVAFDADLVPLAWSVSATITMSLAPVAYVAVLHGHLRWPCRTCTRARTRPPQDYVVLDRAFEAVHRIHTRAGVAAVLAAIVMATLLGIVLGPFGFVSLLMMWCALAWMTSVHLRHRMHRNRCPYCVHAPEASRT